MKKHFKILYKPVASRVEGSALSNLWRVVIQDLNVVEAIPSMIERYSRGNKSTSIKLKSKSTMENDIRSESMSFKVFVYLLKHILKVKKMTFSVTLEFANGDKSVHSQEVNSLKEELNILKEKEEIKNELND